MNTNVLRAQLALHSKKISDLSKAMGISKSALYRRMNGTASFNREEIQSIIQFLNLPNEMAISIFFADEVS